MLSLFTVPLLAVASTNSFDEMGITAAILLAIIGMVLHWRMPRHRMSVEEQVKDGDLSEDEARRQIRFYSVCAPLVTMLGIVVLLLVLIDFS